MSAESAAKNGDRIAPSRAVVPFVPSVAEVPRASWTLSPLRCGLWVAGFGLALGLGGLGAHALQTSRLFAPTPQVATTAQLLGHLQEQVSQLKGSVDSLRSTADAVRPDDQLRGLKRSLEALKQEIEQVRASDSTTLAQLATKIDKTDHDPSAKLADIAARLDKLDREPAAKGADPQAQKLADLSGRLDRMERQVAAATPTGAIPAPAKAASGPVANAKPQLAPLPVAAPKPDPAASSTQAKAAPAKAPTVDAWVVRDVYDGIALVEARRGGLREIEPGEFLPGAGEVRSIERRGRGWVVLTSRGVIETNTF